MIYVVTKQILPDSNKYKIIEVEESLKLLQPLSIVGLDTETTGIDCHKDTLLSLQLGCYDFQIVIDCTTIDINFYKEYLESDREFLFWNAKFDLKWLYKYKIVPKKVYDGFLAEKLMWLGYPTILTPEVYYNINCSRYDYVPENKKKKTKAYYILSTSLKKAGEMYLGVELDKTIRGQIIWKGLSEDVIIYSAHDVKYLEQIKEHQKIELEKKGLLTAIQYENKFVLVLAYVEFCGVKIDKGKWLNKMNKDNERLAKAKKALDDWLINNYPNSKYIVQDTQGDLFLGFNTEPKVTLNWNSTKQVIPIFKDFGVDVEVLDKDKDENKDSIDAKVLKPQEHKCSLIPLYLDYKEAVKVTSTYGDNVLKQIHDNGRLYTNFSQLGADTTRITSGGRDKNSNIKYINFLNLPSDAETRSCFVAEDDNKWISIDYSGQETFLMASIADDKAMIKELTEGSKDIHSLTAYMSYKEIPRDTPIKDIKKLYHDLRQEAKGIEFAIGYGGDANTIASNKGIPIEEAQRIYNEYMKGFSGIKKYQDFCRKDVMDKGYILLNPLTGHKAFIYDYENLKRIKSKFSESGFWEYYREMKRDYPLCNTVTEVKQFFKRKSASEKQSINYRMK